MTCAECGNTLTELEEEHISGLCGDCIAELVREREHRLTRNERYQRAADAGWDTWEDYRGEK